MNPSPRTVELPPLDVRAEIVPRAAASADAATRTVDLTFSTGAGVLRRDWWTGEKYLELLSMKPESVRLDRLNAGAPLLNTHGSYSLEDQIGVVETNSAKVNGKTGTATVRFSQRADVAPIWGDVQDGIVKNVSVGYVVHAYEERKATTEGAIATRTAVDWEPYEISLVPMPADAGAQVRDGKSTLPLHACQITVRAAEPQETPIMEREQSETIVERNPLDPGAPTTTNRITADPDPAPTDAEIGASNERDRVQGIMAACRASRMTTEFQDELIRTGVSLLDSQTRVFDEMRKRGGDNQGPQNAAVRDVKLGDDPLVHVRAGIENALCHRLAGDLRNVKGDAYFPLTDQGRRYRGMTMLDIARLYCQGRGLRVTDLSKHDLAGVALGVTDVRSGGMHTTSDFANLLADVANKTLRAAYEEQPQTFQPLVSIVFLSDFKLTNAVQLGDAPALLEIGEDGEYKSGTISDGKESYQLKSYGRKFAITRKALINDDTNAFARVPMMFGRKARVLESNLVWAQITSNPTMGDGNLLFSAAHANLETDGDVISVESLGRGRTSLRQQTSLDGDYLNLNAVYLLVPTGLETKADQFVTVITPQAAGNVNPFQSKLQVIAEPRLDANSATAWYLAASVGMVDIIHLAYLEGQPGPRVESRIAFDIDGLEIKCGLDVAAKAVDWRGLHKDPGELDT